MSKTASFSLLSCQHEELDRLFDSHQRALFASDVDSALAALVKFEAEEERRT